MKPPRTRNALDVAPRDALRRAHGIVALQVEQRIARLDDLIEARGREADRGQKLELILLGAKAGRLLLESRAYHQRLRV